jgi:hypothetical protein
MPLVRHDLTGHPEEDDLYGTAPAVGAALRFLYRSVTVSDPALPLAKHVIFADMCDRLTRLDGPVLGADQDDRAT